MIPSTAHFVWFGTEFPWLNVLALVSAAKSGGFEKIVLHLEGSRSAVLKYDALERLSNLEIRAIDLRVLAEAAQVDPERVAQLSGAMKSLAARSNIVRALVLAGEGGVYLDMDTVTVASFTALRESHGAFVGEETICFPGWSSRTPSLPERAKAYALASLRLALSAVPRGYRGFRAIARWYSSWVNNAVIGSEPGHPFIRQYLEAMFELPMSRATRRYALGPDLLSRVCTEYRSDERPVTRLGPAYFYPLAPVICAHWWSLTRNPELDDVLTPSTVVVHWYASVRTHKRAKLVDPNYIEAHQHRQLFAKLAHRYVDVY